MLVSYGFIKKYKPANISKAANVKFKTYSLSSIFCIGQ